ncbi:cytochrome P450 [Paraphoma chrysanthemicola]|uniref:Cytochrome P450 n=1 Tax=Paraphoma chrysanthemicola TaxID=798071 RepID=A0A8K0QRF8_9PLEO|nr:cytochrome P450 [Paraphoma chrysanthemicola]
MSPPVSLLALAALPVVYFAIVATYRLFFHPLSKIPGPKLLAITSLSKDIKNDIFGIWYRDVAAIHAQYGRVVRMGPNSVAIDGDPGWDDAYAFRKKGEADFRRDPAYFHVDDGKTASMPSIFLTDREGHGRQRRVLTHAFSQAAMYEQEPTIKHFVDLLITRLRGFAEAGTTVDTVKWYFNFTTFDIIGQLTFGESFGCLEKSQMHPWITMIFESVKASEYLRFLLKYPLTAVLTKRFMGDRIFQVRKEQRDFVIASADRRLAQGAAGSGKKDFMSYVLKHNDEKGLTKEEIWGNSEALIGAGSETTATALSGLLFSLLENPRVMQILVSEIRTAFDSEEAITMRSAAALVYAHACLEEALRVFPPVPVTPARLSPGDFVGGYYLPKDTKIVIHQWASHHNPENWHRPNDYCPERFLPKDHPLYDAAFAHDNKKCFRPFAYGPTECLGKNLAYSEMRLVIAKFLWNFDVTGMPENEGWAKTMTGATLWDKRPFMVKLSLAKH